MDDSALAAWFTAARPRLPTAPFALPGWLAGRRIADPAAWYARLALDLDVMGPEHGPTRAAMEALHRQFGGEIDHER